MITIPTILLIYHDADMVTLRTFEAINAMGQARVVLADTNPVTASSNLSRVSIQPIKGKLNVKAIKSLRHAIRELSPDVVFAVSTSALSTALFATRGTNTKVIGYRGTQARVHRFDPTYRMALLNKRVHHIVCETQDICQYLSRYIPQEKLSWCPKPYSTDWIKDAIVNPMSAWNPSSDTNEYFNLVYIGITKGRPHKGLNYLIDAIQILNLTRPDIKPRLTVIGEADPSDINRATDNVKFTGNRPDAIHYLPSADLFVLPSTRDASPRVVREAQACGLPCIVSDIPGARDLIIPDGPKQSGILVPPANPQAIADAVAYIYDNPTLHLRMIDNARENITDNYNPDNYTSYLTKVMVNNDK